MERIWGGGGEGGVHYSDRGSESMPRACKHAFGSSQGS